MSDFLPPPFPPLPPPPRYKRGDFVKFEGKHYRVLEWVWDFRNERYEYVVEPMPTSFRVGILETELESL